MVELSERQQRLLNLIIQEYVETAAPVGSLALVRKAGLNISPATIRNEMMELEEAGYIFQPHTSAGRVPTDKGYRYFVEALLHESDLSLDEQRTILHQFHQVELELDQWAQLAAAILARVAHNAAVVSAPSAPACKLKHIELVPVQESLAMLIIVLNDGHVRQKMIVTPEEADEETLHAAANKLTVILRGLSAAQIEHLAIPGISELERRVRDAIVRIMRQVDQASYSEIVLEGLALMLQQPEFFGSEKINQILEALQRRDIVAALAPEIVRSEGVKVIIGEEIQSPTLRECTVIVARYGAADKVAGIVGVLGPKRMHYERAIPAVRYVSRVLTGLLEEIYS